MLIGNFHLLVYIHVSWGECLFTKTSQLMLSLVDEQVINFEMPQSVAGYVHRIGRTGRAYNSGASVSLVSFLDNKSPFSHYINSKMHYQLHFALQPLLVHWVFYPRCHQGPNCIMLCHLDICLFHLRFPRMKWILQKK